MHAAEREELILKLLATRGFLSFRELERTVNASPATLRRDLERLDGQGLVARVHGGVKLVEAAPPANGSSLSGVPFHENIARHRAEKETIGRAAAALCVDGEAVMIDGGSTTLQMCPHLAGKNLQILTNSLHIVSSLLGQPGTRITVPGGAVFPEQNIILSAFGEDLMPRFHAPKLFMGSAAVGPQGVMQADPILVAAERRLIERAEKVILLVDSSKFATQSGQVVCGLNEIDMLVTDRSLLDEHRAMIRNADVELLFAD